MKTYNEIKEEQLIKSIEDEERKPFTHNIYSNTNIRKIKRCPDNASYFSRPRP
jgi:hypothetical protein